MNQNRIYRDEVVLGKEIFVFGSNIRGLHGGGAALFAKKYCGAIMGEGDGPQGMSYALPTKYYFDRSVTVERLADNVEAFKNYARENSDKMFFVTRVGCGLAGFKDADVAPMFTDAPLNCVLPTAWRSIVEEAP
jgi:hypothetical protein